MGQQVGTSTIEARRERVVQALLILEGTAVLGTDGDERMVLGGLKELRDSGFGRLEVVVVNHRVEGINSTRTLKRKDLETVPRRQG